MQWIDKYAPISLDTLNIIENGKLELFSKYVSNNRIIIISGPSGCGKNSLV